MSKPTSNLSICITGRIPSVWYTPERRLSYVLEFPGFVCHWMIQYCHLNSTAVIHNTIGDLMYHHDGKLMAKLLTANALSYIAIRSIYYEYCRRLCMACYIHQTRSAQACVRLASKLSNVSI